MMQASIHETHASVTSTRSCRSLVGLKSDLQVDLEASAPEFVRPCSRPQGYSWYRFGAHSTKSGSGRCKPWVHGMRSPMGGGGARFDI